MAWHWQDACEPRKPAIWRGLRLTASTPGKPGWRVEACKPRCLRIVAGNRPRLWARIASHYVDYDAVRAPESASLVVLPPISALDVDEVTAFAPPERARAWARLYATLLERSPASPVYEGEWLLKPSELAEGLVQQIVAQGAGGTIAWDYGTRLYPFVLRDSSSRDDGRVKAWRKHARAGTLPPILLHWVSGLDAAVVLDGHDRLLAAALESTAAPALTLLPVSVEAPDLARAQQVEEALVTSMAAAQRLQAEAGREPLTRMQRVWNVEHANELLIEQYATRLVARPTRAWPLPGRAERWAKEAHQAAVAQRIDSHNLLEDLEHHVT